MKNKLQIGSEVKINKDRVEEFNKTVPTPHKIEYFRYGVLTDYMDTPIGTVYRVRSKNNKYSNFFGYMLEPTKGLSEKFCIFKDTMVDSEVPDFFKRATGVDYNKAKISVNDIRRICATFYNEEIERRTLC